MAEAGTSADDLFAPARPTDGPVALRIGVLGATGTGTAPLRALAASVPGARVVAVADDPGDTAGPARLAELAELAGAAVLDRAALLAGDLDDGLDGVVVATPDPAPALLDCLEAGLPAYVVPVAADPADLRAAVSLEDAGGRRLVQTGFLRRHDPAHLALRRAAGGLGAVRVLRGADRGGPGSWADQALAGLDAAAWLVGGSPVGVRVDHAEPGGPVLLTARVTDPHVPAPAPGTVVARLEVHPRPRGGHDVRCELVGARATTGLAAPPAVRLVAGGRARTALPPGADARFADATRTGLSAWVRSVRTGRGAGASLWDYYVAAEAVAAARASWDGRTSVRVDPGPRPAVYDVPHRVVAQAAGPRPSR